MLIIKLFLIATLLGLVLTWVLILIICKYGVKWTTQPPLAFHHGHSLSVPRFGGLAIAVAFAVISIFAHYALPADPESARLRLVVILGSLSMFCLGFIDDFRSIGAKFKLVGQIAIASFVYLEGIQINKLRVFGLFVIYDTGVYGYFITIFWLVAVTNLINLIDGIDGLAGGVCFMLMCLLACVSWNVDAFSWVCAVGISASLLGFLRFNFPPAKIYMGDGGAYFLGFLIGILTITNSHKGTVMAALTAPLFALALPIIDVIYAIVRRALKGLPIFRPDQKHIHHHLTSVGFSRRKAVLTLYGISLVFLLIAFIWFWSDGKLFPILVGVLFFIVLVCARTFGFIQDFNSIGRTVGNSFKNRKETRYALLLSSWLQMEAERCDSIDNLWDDFKFISMKLGFSEITLKLADGEKIWQSTLENQIPESIYESFHDLHADGFMKLTIKANTEGHDLALFDLLSELAAEAWLNAVVRWQSIHGLPAKFSSAASTRVETKSRGRKSCVPSRSLPKLDV